MGDIALVNGEIVRSQYGDISITTSDNDDIIQQAINSIYTKFGEMYLHPELGNKMLNGRYKIADDMSDVEADCQEAMMYDERIDSVDEISIVRSSRIRGSVDINFTITTIYGDVLSSDITVNIT